MNRVQFTALYTIVRKEIVRMLRIWPQTFLPPVITMSLYFMIFGELIGQKIGEMHNFKYIQYISPGLIMMAVITNAYANVSSSFFGSKFQRNVEELLIAPIAIWVILWGHVLGGVVRGLIVGILVMLVSLVFTKLPILHPLYMLLVATLTGVLFALAGMLNAIYAKKFDDIAIVPTFILTPLTYLGGIFYSVDLLPKFWQNLTYANPVFYMINGFRYCMLGVSDMDLKFSIGIILVFILMIYSTAAYVLHKGKGLYN